jgi:thioredoxin reductase (NADPH)
MQEEKMIIIGSGPAGYTAALYAARANIEPLLFAGNEPGGQVALTYEVENYPGFPEGANGPDLIDSFRKQAEKFGTRVEYDHVTEVDWNGPPFIVKTLGGREYSALSIIVTSGASPRKLNVPGERELVGHGVSYCGTCDGFFFKGKDVLVVGGGDSAIEEGLFLTRFATHVRVIHRRDSLRASKILQDRASRNEKMSYIWDTVVESIHHNEAGVVDRVEVKNLKTGETSSL